MLLLVSIRIARRSGKIGLGRELQDGLRLLGFDHLEIVLVKIGDEAALLSETV